MVNLRSAFVAASKQAFGSMYCIDVPCSASRNIWSHTAELLHKLTAEALIYGRPSTASLCRLATVGALVALLLAVTLRVATGAWPPDHQSARHGIGISLIWGAGGGLLLTAVVSIHANWYKWSVLRWANDLSLLGNRVESVRFVLMPPAKYKGLHNQVNMVLANSLMASLLNATLILPPMHSHFLAPEGACASGRLSALDAATLRIPSLPRCSVQIPFGRMWDPGVFAEVMRPFFRTMALNDGDAADGGVTRAAVSLTGGNLPQFYVAGDLDSQHHRSRLALALAGDAISPASLAFLTSMASSGTPTDVPTLQLLNASILPKLLVRDASQARYYARLRHALSIALVPSTELMPLASQILAFLQNASFRAGGVGAFVTIQARLEWDMATTKWRPPSQVGHAVPSAEQIVAFLRTPSVRQYTSALGAKPVLYVACALQGTALDAALAPLRADWTVVTKFDVFPHFDQLLPHRELAATVERHVLTQGHVFVGCGLSSLSHYVKERILLAGGTTLDYMMPAHCQNRMCPEDYHDHQGVWISLSTEAATAMTTAVSPQLSPLLSRGVDAAPRMRRTCLAARMAAASSDAGRESASSRTRSPGVERAALNTLRQLLPVKLQAGSRASSHGPVGPAVHVGRNWSLPWAVRELPEANAFLATSVCKHGGHFFGGIGARADGGGEVPSRASRLHLCNRSRPFEMQGVPSGVWDAELSAVLPCTSPRRVTDFPDKYCGMGLHKAVSRQKGLGTIGDRKRITGLTLILGESHAGNIWHFVRELFFAFTINDLARKVGFPVRSVLLSAQDMTQANASTASPHGSVPLSSDWQSRTLSAVLGPGVHYQSLAKAEGHCFDAVASKLTRSFSMGVVSGRGVRRAVWSACGLKGGGTHDKASRRAILLILRGGTRRLYNSAAVLGLLRTWSALGMLGGQPLPVRVFIPGAASFCEQVAAFAAARLVIGFSGADLTNAIFMQDDALLIELFTVDFYATHYGRRAPADAATIDATDMNDFSSYLSRMHRLYLQGFVTIPRSLKVGDSDTACSRHGSYYYAAHCVHMVDLDRMQPVLFRARALLAAAANDSVELLRESPATI